MLVSTSVLGQVSSAGRPAEAGAGDGASDRSSAAFVEIVGLPSCSDQGPLRLSLVSSLQVLGDRLPR